MNPQEEQLTPKQQRAFATILFVTVLVFCSVFAYAYIKGKQTQTSVQPVKLVRVDQFANLKHWRNKGKVVRIARGTSGQDAGKHLSNARSGSRSWTISQFPKQDEDGLPHVCAYSASSGGWYVSVKDVVSVPRDAEPGFYLVHCQVDRQVHDYFIEVMPAATRTSSSASVAKK